MSKKLLIILAILLSASIGLLAYISLSPGKNSVGLENLEEMSEGPLEEAPPAIKLISQIEELSLPTTIGGEAFGYWYFEAQFPVEVVTNLGVVIATGLATAKGDWMTENYVPFEAVLDGAVSETVSAEVIFRKANPSGLPENDDAISIPAVIHPPKGAMETMTVKAYFSSTVENDCSAVTPVERVIPRTNEVAKTAILELLKGLQGRTNLTTNINHGTKLNFITIQDGVAHADFDAELNKNTGGSCRITAIRAQITETLKQFPTVKEVVISINGETEGILEP